MIKTREFGEELKKLGFEFYSGVPCSFLKNLINYAINDCEYVMAANEGDAVAIASGAFLGGKKSVLLMQNSGLMNAVSPLVSLNYIFKIPVLGFVSFRGETGVPDEPQHELTGQITTQLLDLMRIKWEYLSYDLEEAMHQLVQANLYIENNESFFLVVKKAIFEEQVLQKKELPLSLNKMKIEKKSVDQLPSRNDVLNTINSLKDSQTVQLATTGKTGRELYEIEDAHNNLYMVGSMGCVSSLGLGLAMVQKDKDIVVIDGDGSLIMRMGSLTTNGNYSPPNMLHILLDNNTYDSTGGQTTVSHNMNFVEIADSSGYKTSIYIHNLAELESAIKKWKKTKGLTFLYMRIAKGSKQPLGRPKIKPYEIKERLQLFFKGV